MKLYLHQFLSQAGLFKTKKEVYDAVQGGVVEVDGRKVCDPKYRFNPLKKTVSFRGRLLSIVEEKTYILLNKPEGYLSSKLTLRDVKLGKKSVFELLGGDVGESTRNSLFCVGRLDEDTSGLLILTNDGKLSSRITNPRNKVEKTYLAVLDRPLTPLESRVIESGVTIELEENGKVAKYKTKLCKVKRIGEKTVEITLYEGRKREVRRIFQSVGIKVGKLERVAVGGLQLEELRLKRGQYMISGQDILERIYLHQRA
ncbi:MAG: pseudouridine synthase [Candidatus Altiarchaeota archaeon]|nr:pseudouridine synthase [Candidatus Altiarchaeota archaeon]